MNFSNLSVSLRTMTERVFGPYIDQINILRFAAIGIAIVEFLIGFYGMLFLPGTTLEEINRAYCYLYVLYAACGSTALFLISHLIWCNAQSGEDEEDELEILYGETVSVPPAKKEAHPDHGIYAPEPQAPRFTSVVTMPTGATMTLPRRAIGPDEQELPTEASASQYN